MKKYTLFPNIDLTTLKNESIAYLNANFDVEDVGHRNNALKWLGTPLELTEIPSLSTLFSAESLEVTGVSHLTINADWLNINEYSVNILLVPLMDYEECSLKLYDVVPGATYTNFQYNESDCTLVETVTLTNPIFLRKNTPFTIETTSFTTLSDLLVIFFNTSDTDRYFV